MENLPLDILRVINRYALHREKPRAYLNLALSCLSLYAALANPVHYFALCYLFYYVRRCDVPRVKDILVNIPKDTEIDIHRLSVELNLLLNDWIITEKQQCMVQCIFLHEVLRKKISVCHQHIALHRMAVAGNMDYIIKALKIVSFAWDDTSEYYDAILESLPVPSLCEILELMLTGEICTVEDLIRGLPIMFQVEPQLYRAISMGISDEWTFEEADAYISCDIIYEMPELVQPTFQKILDGKQVWAKNQVPRGYRVPQYHWFSSGSDEDIPPFSCT